MYNYNPLSTQRMTMRIKESELSYNLLCMDQDYPMAGGRVAGLQDCRDKTPMGCPTYKTAHSALARNGRASRDLWGRHSPPPPPRSPLHNNVANLPT
jgi:hypothetical protein